MPRRQCDFKIDAVLLLRGRRFPARQFRNAAADIENEKRRNDANHEHAAPSDVLEQQRRRRSRRGNNRWDNPIAASLIQNGGPCEKSIPW